MDHEDDEIEFDVDWSSNNKRRNIANNLILMYKVNVKICSIARFAILHNALISEVDRLENIIDNYLNYNNR